MPLSHIQKSPGDPLDLDEIVDLLGIAGDLLHGAFLAATAAAAPDGAAVARIIYVAEEDIAVAKAAIETRRAAAAPAAEANASRPEARHGRR